MSDTRFPTPVRVIIRHHPENIIANAWDAVEFLRSWPARHSMAYRRALQHCLDALDGIRTPKRAWLSFTAALREEGLIA